MNIDTLATLVIAATAVASTVASVLFLGVRVGRLIGTSEEHMRTSEADRQSIWRELRQLGSALTRHVEIYHGTHRDRR